MLVKKTEIRYVPDGEYDEVKKTFAPGHYFTKLYYEDGTAIERPSTDAEIARYRGTFGAVDAGAVVV